MIELLYECDGMSPFDYSSEHVTGLQVFHRGKFIQILEGPEAEVWSGFDALGGDLGHIMSTKIRERSLFSWNARLITEEVLPHRVTRKLVEFARFVEAGASSDPMVGGSNTAKNAIAMLTGVIGGETAAQTIASGPFGAHLSGRSGNRAWVAV